VDAGQVWNQSLAQHALLPFAWIGGHGTEPYEQNTQQSPARGSNRVPQPLQ
jgi:hypothetical protein